MIISSSILSADFSNLAEQIHQAELAGVDWIHIDVMDGHFVPNITMGPFIVETCRRISNKPLDVHLMIERPEQQIDSFIKAGADYLSVHIEGNPNIQRFLQKIRDAGAHPGVAINPGTPPVAIEAVLPYVDFVLVMTVNPGYSGQKFLPDMTFKIQKIRQMLNEINPSALIEVDGGITDETLPLVKAAGAEICVAATSIFKHKDGIQAGIQALRNSEIK